MIKLSENISYVAVTVLVITWMTVIDTTTVFVGVGRILVVVELAAPENVVTGGGVLLHIVSATDPKLYVSGLTESRRPLYCRCLFR